MLDRLRVLAQSAAVGGLIWCLAALAAAALARSSRPADPAELAARLDQVAQLPAIGLAAWSALLLTNRRPTAAP